MGGVIRENLFSIKINVLNCNMSVDYYEYYYLNCALYAKDFRFFLLLHSFLFMCSGIVYRDSRAIQPIFWRLIPHFTYRPTMHIEKIHLPYSSMCLRAGIRLHRTAAQARANPIRIHITYNRNNNNLCTRIQSRVYCNYKKHKLKWDSLSNLSQIRIPRFVCLYIYIFIAN